MPALGQSLGSGEGPVAGGDHQATETWKAGLTLVTCGAIEFATPLTPTGTVLPPTWVLVVVLAGVFMAAAWSAAAGTRRGCLFVTLGIMTATRRELA